MLRMIPSVVGSVLLGGFTVAAAQLPPEIMMDRHLLQAERLMVEEDYGAALEAMNEIVALQQEHNLTLPEEFHFKYAQAAFSAGLIPDALESVNQYLAEAGRDSEFYREALELLNEAERIQATAEQIQTEACAGQPEGTACWMELANQAGMLRLEWLPRQGRDRDLDSGVFRWPGPGDGNAYMGQG